MDTVEMLLERLLSLPTDLETYFLSMMSRMDVEYHEEGARLLPLVHAARRPLPLATFEFSGESDPEFAINAPIDVHAQQRQLEDRQILTSQVKPRGADLVKITAAGLGEDRLLPTVEFVHRTVRDFICDKAYTGDSERKGDSPWIFRCGRVFMSRLFGANQGAYLLPSVPTLVAMHLPNYSTSWLTTLAAWRSD